MGGRVDNRVVIVTVAAKGMGREICLTLAREGSNVVLAAREAAPIAALAEEIGKRAIAHPTDVTDETAVRALVARAHEAFGGVDILVANAGGPPRGYFDELPDERWYGAFEVSLLSVVRLRYQ